MGEILMEMEMDMGLNLSAEINLLPLLKKMRRRMTRDQELTIKIKAARK
jgi:hypothetical protein